MTFTRRVFGHPSQATVPAPRLYGRRVMLRPLMPTDFAPWSEVRRRNDAWLTPWEPRRPPGLNDPAHDRDAFTHRCTSRDRDRQAGTAFGFGLFVDNAIAGEVNINSIARGAMQCGTVGYWIDQTHAGHRYVAEAVVVLAKFSFEELHLHRLEVCIVPRNANSRRVMDVLEFREEGIAQRFLEINGTWEDHLRYGFTAEEWAERQSVLASDWLSEPG